MNHTYIPNNEQNSTISIQNVHIHNNTVLQSDFYKMHYDKKEDKNIVEGIDTINPVDLDNLLKNIINNSENEDPCS